MMRRKIMGHALTIDTLAYAKRLIAVGMPPRQAEEQIEIFAEIIDSNIATKQDIESIHRDIESIHRDIESIHRDIELIHRDMKEMESSLKRDMKEMEGSLKRDMKEIEGSLQRDIKELEMKMTIRLGAIMTAGIAVVATLVKLL
jgi:hypothetical protein